MVRKANQVLRVRPVQWARSASQERLVSVESLERLADRATMVVQVPLVLQVSLGCAEVEEIAERTDLQELQALTDRRARRDRKERTEIKEEKDHEDHVVFPDAEAQPVLLVNAATPDLKANEARQAQKATVDLTVLRAKPATTALRDHRVHQDLRVPTEIPDHQDPGETTARAVSLEKSVFQDLAVNAVNQARVER